MTLFTNSPTASLGYTGSVRRNRAIVGDASWYTGTLTGDESHVDVTIPFTINWFGSSSTTIGITTNGALSPTGGYAQYLYDFTANSNGFSQDALCVLNNDADTFWTGVPVRYGFKTAAFEGHDALVVLWDDLANFNAYRSPSGFSTPFATPFAYASGRSTSYDNPGTNQFQVLVVNRNDVQPGAFDVVYNYGRVNWVYNFDFLTVGFSTTNGAATGYWYDHPDTGGLCGYTGVGSYTLTDYPGTSTTHALVDGGARELVSQSFDVTVNEAAFPLSPSGGTVPGRFIFRFRSTTTSFPGVSAHMDFAAYPPLEVLIERGFTPVPAQRRAFNA
jgi:hypothetical protein